MGGGEGACSPQYLALIGRAEGRGGASAWIWRPGFPQGIPPDSGSRLVDHRATAVTPARAACLRSGAQWTPKPSGSPIPSRVSPAPVARPVGSPAFPCLSPPGQAPARRSQVHLRSLWLCDRCSKPRFPLLYAEDDKPCFAGWGSGLGMLECGVRAERQAN